MSVKLNYRTDARDTEDSVFDKIVDRCGEFVEAGQIDEALRLADEHPEHAERLRQLLPAIEALASFNDLPGAHLDDEQRPSRQLGDFRIVREIGRGGMGVVYEAQQISLNRCVALKVLPLAAMLDARRLERFRHEAQAAAMLRHPNIVAVYSVGCERGVHYYAMDYIDGPSLAQVIDVRGKGESGKGKEDDSGTPRSDSLSPLLLPPSTVDKAHLCTLRNTQPVEFFRAIAQLCIQAAEALDYAHQMGVVHRDVKPSNLLLDAAGKLWITDFGLAMTQSDVGLTMTGDLLGTLRYMSPEQAAGKRLPLDHRTDIYSLGITLYELLAGRPAFDQTERGELLRAVADVDPPSLRKINSSIPADLETIVRKAMEKDAADRYCTAGELAADLKRYLEDRPIVAQPPTIAAHARKWVRRHSAVVAFSAVALLIAAAGFAWSALLIGRQAQRAEDNLGLALSALEQTLAESVVGDLVVEPSDAKRKELQRRGIAFYEQFARKNGVAPTTWPTYRLLVFNQRLSEAFELKTENPTAAEQAYIEAISLGEQLVAATDGDPKNQARLVHAIDDYGVFFADTKRFDQAIVQSNRASEFVNRLVTEHPGFALNSYLVGKNRYNRSVYVASMGRKDEAERLCREALAHLDKAFDLQSDDLLVPKTLAQCRYNLGLYLAERGATDEAAEFWEKSLRDWRALTLLRPLSSEYQSRAGATLSNLAALASQHGDHTKCRRLAEEALVHQRGALKLTPIYPRAQQFLRTHYKHLSQSLADLGDYEALAASAEERASELADVPFETCQAAISLAACAQHAQAADGLAAEAKRAKVDHLFARSLEILADARARYEFDAAIFVVGDGYLQVGDHLQAAERTANARQAGEAALAIFTDLQAKQPRENWPQFYEAIAAAKQRIADSPASDSRAGSSESDTTASQETQR